MNFCVLSFFVSFFKLNQLSADHYICIHVNKVVISAAQRYMWRRIPLEEKVKSFSNRSLSKFKSDLTSCCSFCFTLGFCNTRGDLFCSVMTSGVIWPSSGLWGFLQKKQSILTLVFLAPEIRILSACVCLCASFRLVRGCKLLQACVLVHVSWSEMSHSVCVCVCASACAMSSPDRRCCGPSSGCSELLLVS